MIKRSLVQRLIVPVSAVVFVSIVAIGTIFSLQYEKEIQENVAFQVSSFHQQISSLLTLVDDIETKRVKTAVTYFRERSAAFGVPHAGALVMVGEERAPNIQFGARSQANNGELVDQVKTVTGAGATVFSVRNGEFIRITTNVKKDDGTRAVGTKLDPTGRAIVALRDHRSFYGVVDILGKPYITAYEPMISSSGEVFGAWYTGYQLSELIMLEQMIHASRVLDDGFTALVDNKGVVRFHSDHVSSGFVDSLLKGSSADLTSAWVTEQRPFPAWGYTVVTGYSRAEITSHIDAIRWLVTIAVVVASLLLVAVITWFVRRVIVKPIKGVVEKMNNADLNTVVHEGREDEIGELTASFDRFVANIRNVLVHVDGAAETIVSSVSQISASTQQMASGASEQTQQATDVSAAIDQLTKTVEESSQNAAATAEAAHESREIAERGGTSVRATVNEMREVSAVVGRTAETIRVLHQASGQIGEIVTVIEEIADQTNLLALNAAIEAARAGEQGRGFAVVADEVRKLAERTTKATKEIADTIGSVQTETAHAMQAIGEGTGTVERGVVVAEEAGQSLLLIVENSQRLADMVKGMSAVTSDQSEGLSRISQSIQTIGMVTNENAHSTEQVAEAVEHLNGLTVEMHQLVKQFQLRSDDKERGSPVVKDRRTAARTREPITEFSM